MAGTAKTTSPARLLRPPPGNGRGTPAAPSASNPKNLPTPTVDGADNEPDKDEDDTHQGAASAGTGNASDVQSREAALRNAVDPGKQATMNDVALASSKEGRRAMRAANDYNRMTPGILGASSGGAGLTPESRWRQMFPNKPTGYANGKPPNMSAADAAVAAGPQKVQMQPKPVPVPARNPDGSKGPAPTVAENLALYKSPTQIAPVNPSASPLHPNSEESLSPVARAYENAQRAQEDQTSPEKSAAIANRFASPNQTTPAPAPATPQFQNPAINIGQPLATTHENNVQGLTVASPKPTGALSIDNFHPNMEKEPDEEELHRQIAGATGKPKLASTGGGY